MPVGSCQANCTPNANGTYCCSDNNCNNVLYCYTGVYVQGEYITSQMNKTVCPAQTSFCQVYEKNFIKFKKKLKQTISLKKNRTFTATIHPMVLL